MHKFLFIVCNLLLLSNCILVSNYAMAEKANKLPLNPKHIAQFKRDLNTAEFSGFAVIADKNDILMQEYFGLANTREQTPFRLETQIDIGSITKTLVGIAASNLIDAGKLNPEHTLSWYFPTVPKDKKHITVHQLLTHSAGFPGAVGGDYDYVEQTEFVKLAFEAALLFKPGTGYEYSNVGFGLMAAIISQITKQSYETWLNDLAISPMKLKRTGYASVYSPQLAETNMAGDLVNQASWGGTKPGWHLVGNGGMLSSAADLLQLGRMMLANPNHTMLQPYVLETGGGSHYGYGVVLQEDPDLGAMYWHNGGNNFFYTDFFILPEQELVVLLHSNNPITQSGATGRLLATLKGQPLPALAQVSTLLDIPTDNAVGKLSLAFLEAIADTSSLKWQQLLTQRAHPAFLEAAPMEAHTEMHTMLHSEFANIEVLGYRDLKADSQGDNKVDNKGVAELIVRTKPNNATYTLSVHYKTEGKALMLTGIGVE